ncbi:MAG TPA: class I SAM-dependent methyltransferase [Puia sp.]|nr:class I SAM-dependent methyltransferase [Puia sp.]
MSLVEEKYNDWHRNYADSISREDEIKLMLWHKNVLSVLKKEELKGLRVLEIGCGIGDFSIYLAKNFDVQVTGTDFSPMAIEIAQKKQSIHAGRVDFRVADAQDLPFEDASFDLIISCECIEHVPNPQKMIDEMHRVLKDKGRFVLTTENYSNAFAYYFLYLKLAKKSYDSGSGEQPIENFFVYWRILAKFRRAGFKQVRCFGNEFTFLLIPGTAPDKFALKDTRSPLLRRLLKPLGRRMTYYGVKE